MNKTDSYRMNDALEQMIRHANDVLYIANNSGDDVAKERVQKVFATVFADIDLKLMEPLYKEFPELRPPSAAPF